MVRVVADTNVYIDWLNSGRHEDVLFLADTVKYLSAVVMMELRAGAFSASDRRELMGVESGFVRTRRVLVPSRSVYAESGDVLRRLQRERHYGVDRPGIVNDVLIAMSARAIGAVVVTGNARDFQAIQSVRRFDLSVV